FQGAANRSSYLTGGWYFYPFQADRGPKIIGIVMTAFLDRWTPENPDPHAFSPRLSYGANSNNYQTSTWWQRDSDYLRLKNVELGWTMPSRWASKIHCSSMRFYVQGVNLFTVSKFMSDFWDPETGADKYPMQRQVFIGVNLTF
ncbi:MAG: SusC/RagA family TonB-linked outer membrane protein, partial [Alistipes sp.]|nr:SusC/RagA family TonB-linked outer membrane protein [Alistipes sp.]